MTSVSSLIIPIMGLRIKYVKQHVYVDGESHAVRIFFNKEKDTWETQPKALKGLILFMSSPPDENTEYIEVTAVTRNGTTIFGKPVRS